MSAPVIGLSTYAEPARWAAWQAPAALLPTSYIDQVTEAGGVPLLLPPVPGIARALGRLDGLILTGGGDLDPAGYGAEPDPGPAASTPSAIRRSWSCSRPRWPTGCRSSASAAGCS